MESISNVFRSKCAWKIQITRLMSNSREVISKPVAVVVRLLDRREFSRIPLQELVLKWPRVSKRDGVAVQLQDIALHSVEGRLASETRATMIESIDSPLAQAAWFCLSTKYLEFVRQNSTGNVISAEDTKNTLCREFECCLLRNYHDFGGNIHQHSC